ncbi:vinculin-like [Zophobas morio]
MLCLKLSGERANLLEKGSYRSAFESAISELKKNSIGLVQTVKTYADQFDNPAGTVMRDFYIQEIQLACEEISRLVNLRIILDDSLFPPGDLSLSLACVKEALQAGKMGAYVDEEIKKQLSSNFDKLIEEGQRILENCDNLESLEKTQKLISESKKEVKKVEELACKLQENPEDKTAELAYGVACEELLENIFRLDEDYKNTLTSQRERYALSLSESSHLIMDAAAAGDSKGVETIATQFYKDAEVLDKVAKTVASVTEDGLKSAAVLQAAANLSKYHPVFLAAYKLCPRTGNAADLQRAAQTQEEWLHRYDELLIAMDRATPTFAGSIAVAEELFYKAADQTQAACEKGDQQGFLRAKQKVQFIEGRLQSLLERELTASGGLETKTGSSESDLKKALDQVAAISLSSMDNFIAVYSGIKVEGLLRPAKAVIRLKDAGEAKKMEAPSEGGDQQTRIVREDKVIIFEQMKRLRTADNIIGKAAQGLHQAVSRWDDHENDLISTMKKISENFARLSILKDEVLKKTELIEVSRFIVEDARKAASMASELAKHCVDKRLAQDLQTRVIQADTLSTQLKILSTVKASIPDDQQADQQLSVSAQNLMNVCKGLLSEAHSCAIKCPQSSALIQKWRTVEYKFQ